MVLFQLRPLHTSNVRAQLEQQLTCKTQRRLCDTKQSVVEQPAVARRAPLSTWSFKLSTTQVSGLHDNVPPQPVKLFHVGVNTPWVPVPWQLLLLE